MSAALLPTTSDREAWTPDEAAAIEAAGLTFTFPYGDRKGQTVLAPRAVITKFMHTAERTGLDPLARQLYCIPRMGRDGIEWTVQTSIDGYRVVAERSGQYAGQDPAEWLTDKGEWVQVFIKSVHGDHPLAARVAAYRHDWSRPSVGIATWDEYVQTKSNGEITAMWKQRGPGQLAKCAEALALRKLTPQDLSGLYTDAEMESATPVEADDEEKPRHVMTTIATRARAAQARTEAPQEADEEPVDAEVVEESDEPLSPPETDADGTVLGAFPCSRCGAPNTVDDDAAICGDCEAQIENEEQGS